MNAETDDQKKIERYNILLVDDEKGIRKMLKQALDRFDYKVVEAENGIEAIQIIENGHSIDGIITDMIMPEMGGLLFVKEIYSRVREDPRFKIPLFIATGYANRNDSQQARGYAKAINSYLGIDPDFDPFIIKPFDLMEIKQKLEQMLDYKEKTANPQPASN